MKTLPLFLIVSVVLHACALHKLTASPADPSDPWVKAADTVTQRLFDEQQPTLNAATAELSPEAQALVQAAWVALEQVVRDAAAQGVGYIQTLDDDEHGQDQGPAMAVQNIRRILGSLHQAVHEPDAPAVEVTP